METSTADHKLENWTINAFKILDVNKRVNLIKNEVQLLYFPKNTSLNAKNLLRNLNVENFPNVFVILIDFDEEIDEILNLISWKFTNRPLMVQVKSENSLNFYIKRENEFKRIESGSSNERITAETLIGNLKTSIIKTDFSQLTAHDGGFIKHCHAFDSCDDFCFRLLNLYEDNFNVEMKCEIFLSVIKNDNFNFFLAFFNVFEHEELNFFSGGKLKNIIKHLIESKDISNFKIAIKFLVFSFTGLNEFFLHTFLELVQLTIKFKLYEFYEALKDLKVGYYEANDFEILRAAYDLEDSFQISLNSNLNLYRRLLIKMLNFFFQNSNKMFNDVKVEFMFQEFLIGLLSDKTVAKELFKSGELAMPVLRHGFDLNLKFFYAKLIEFFSVRDRKNLLSVGNPLILLVKDNSNINSVKFVWKIIEKNLSKSEMRKLATKSNLIYTFAGSAKSLEICEFIWLKIKSLVKDDEILRELLLPPKVLSDSTALFRSACCNNEYSFKFFLEKVYLELFEPKEFVYKTNSESLTFYQCLAKSPTLSNVEFASNLLKKYLSCDELKDFITIEGSEGKNILHLTSLNGKNEDLVKFLANFIEREFGIEELRKMLCKIDDQGFNPFHHAIQNNNNLQIIENFVSLYEEKFSLKEIKKIFDINKLIQIYNIFKNSYLSDKQNLILENVLKKYFDPIASYYLELNDLMMANGDSCDDLMIFFVKIEGKNDVIEFLFFEIKIFNYFATFAQSQSKFEFFCHKIVELIKDKEKLKKILLAKGLDGSIALYSLFYDNCFESSEDENSDLENSDCGVERKDFFLFLFDKIYCEHLDLEDFFYDLMDNIYFHQVLMLKSFLFFELVVKKMKVKLSNEKFREFLLSKHNNKSILHYMARFSDEMKEKWLLLKNLVKSELSSQEIRDILMENDGNDQVLLHEVDFVTPEQFQGTILSFYLEYFTVEEVDAIIRRKNNERMIFGPETAELLCKMIRTFQN